LVWGIGNTDRNTGSNGGREGTIKMRERERDVHEEDIYRI
jgi:hypothetical protein